MKMSNKKSISKVFFTRFMLISTFMILFFSLFNIRMNYLQYQYNKNEIHNKYMLLYKQKLRNEVNKVAYYLEKMIETSSKYNLSSDEIKNEALREIVNLRFDQTGYFFGATYNGDPLFSNGIITTGQENLTDLTDKNGTKIFQSYLDAIRKPDGDFIRYYWHKLDENIPKEKISYVQAVPEWNWIIGAGFYTEDLQKQIAEQTESLEYEVKSEIIRLVIFVIFLILLLYIMALSISKKIHREFDLLIDSFRNPEEKLKKIDSRKIQFQDIAELAESARKMIDQIVQSKAELAEKEQELRNIININPHFVFVKNRKGKYIMANQAIARFYGLTPEELIGKTDEEAAPSKKDARKYRSDDLLILKGKKEKIIVEETILDKQGNTRYLYTIKKPIKIATEEDLCVLGICLDITELKKAQLELEKKNQELNRQIIQRQKTEESLEDTRKQMLSFIQNSTNVFFVHTSKNIVTYVSPQCEKILGYKPYEVLGNWQDLLSDNPENEKGMYLTQKALATGKAQDPYELEMIHKNGSKVWVEVHEAPVKVGDSMIIVGSLSDVTARKIAQQDLLKQQEKLEIMVRNRTEELNEQNKFYRKTQKAFMYLMEDLYNVQKELEEKNKELIYANQELGSFSHTVSHDLTAPLRTIESYSKIFMDIYARELDDTAKGYVEIIINSAIHMKELIADLLEFSKVSKRDIKREQFNIGREFDSVFNEMKTDFPDKDIRFECRADVGVIADKSMIRLVIMNLLSNAIKYSSKKEVIEIQIGMNEKANEYEFFVRDNGIGFSSEYKEKLFGIFSRLHTTEEFEGTGVGLAIVKRIILKHNGTVKAISEPGKGATFLFTLPKNVHLGADNKTPEEIEKQAEKLKEIERQQPDLFDEWYDDDPDRDIHSNL